MTTDAARERVRAWAKKQASVAITLEAPVSKRHWSMTLGDIGGRFDIGPALEAAAAVGRNATQWDRLLHGGHDYDVQIDPKFRFDEKRLDKQLGRVAAAIHVAPTPGRAAIDPATGVVQITEPAKRGVDLDADATKKALMPGGPESLAHGATANLVAKDSEPAIRDSDLKRVDTLLASFHTDFSSSSSNRQSNVALAAHHIDGTLLAPGEVFSYNQVVGPREPKLGWKDAPTYQDGQVVPGPGGGVCQVSTTLYNAVLRANLPVTMRSHHSMPVHYVEPGRDATVAYGDIDFRFKNSTDAPLLVSSPPKGGVLTFNLYGAASAKPADISLESSSHTPTSNGGFVVTTYRVSKAADGTITREKLSTDTYEPVPSSHPAAKPKPAPGTKPVSAPAKPTTPMAPTKSAAPVSPVAPSEDDGFPSA